MTKKRRLSLFFVLILLPEKYIIAMYIVKNKEVWKMKKKIAIICAAVMLLMSVSQSVGAVNVIMNSSFLKFPDQEPLVVNGTTLVPLRAVAEALGLDITWDDPTDTVVVKKDNFFVELVIGSDKAKTPGGVKTLSQCPVIINGRTMVPLRFIAEEMGLTVLWNQEYQRVIINGQVDTQTVVTPPVEEVSEVEDASEADNSVEEASTEVEEIIEEETGAAVEYISIDLPASSILLEIPDTYLPEDTDDEESFAYRSLDGFDAQHTYNWEIVSTYECYADENAKNGIMYIVQELGSYEGEVYDVARAADEYPERPESVDVDFGYLMSEAMRLIIEQACAENGVEVPEDMENLPEDEEELAVLVGFASAEEYSAYMETIDTQEIMEQIPEYIEYREWQIANSEYRTEVKEIDNAKSYAIRKFDEVFAEFDDETWAAIFSDNLNSDEEVRYEGVEILDFDGKKAVHATIFAEDPDDEQGVYEYYRYQDGDTLVTIFGGTLFGSEASPEICDILANMLIQ